MTSNNSTLMVPIILDDNLVNRFFERFTPVTESGCWLWDSYSHEREYGLIKHNGKMLRAHRVSYVIHHGQIPDGMLVCHKCDVTPCVNPDHLFLGSSFDNTRDMINKGRRYTTIGENHPHAKLTNQDIINIRNDHRYYYVIGAQYGVCKQTVCDIKRGKIWKHV